MTNQTETRFEADSDFDDRIASFDGSAISDERFYYRSDLEDIERVVTVSVPCRVFTGLRRYGKTSFLRRIERLCNGANREWKPEESRFPDPGVKAYFIPGVANGFAAAITAALDEPRDGFVKKLVLLDDLQNVEPGFDEVDNKQAIEKAVKRLFEEASRHRESGVNVVLAEPTSHRDWLEGIHRSAPMASAQGPVQGRPRREALLGPLLRRWSGGMLDHVSGQMPTLTLDESRALLTGSPSHAKGNSGRRFQLAEDAVGVLHQAFAGNPWFLGAAHQRLAKIEDPSMLDQHEIEKFIAEVDESIADDTKGLGSIYKSLTDVERFVVHVLHASHPVENEMAKSIIDHPRPAQVWNVDAAGIATINTLETLGLIELGDGRPKRLKSKPFIDTVTRELKGQSIFDDPSTIDAKLWKKVFVLRHPAEMTETKAIIHQLSDICFDDSSESVAYWSKYVEWLKHLRDNDSRRQPHFLVICGNLLPGSLEDVADPGLVDNRYKSLLGSAFSEIAKAAGFLKRVGNESSELSEQVIILPGVLDHRWVTKGNPADKAEWTRRQYRDAWDSLVEAFGFSPRAPANEQDDEEDHRLNFDPVCFEHARIAFVPFDSVAIEGVNYLLGSQAVVEIADIRRRIRSQFAEDWRRLRNPVVFAASENRSDSKEGRENGSDSKEAGEHGRSEFHNTWKQFLRQTWRYVIVERPPEDDGSGIMPEEIKVSAFRWEQQHIVRPRNRGAGGRIKLETTTLLSETGVVADPSIRHAADRIKKFDADHPMLSLGVMHHCPQTRRQATLVEFLEAYRFRQKLAQIGVHYMLHGHLSRQHSITESVVYRGAPKDEPPQRINLISAGTFSDLFGQVPDEISDELDDQPAGPTFNVIEVTPPSRVPGGENEDFQVDVEFYYWPTGADGFPEGYPGSGGS